MTRSAATLDPPTVRKRRGPAPGTAAIADDAEQAVLSAILLDATVTENARAELRGEHFLDGRNEKIYRAMLAISSSGRAIDPYTVAEELEQRGDLELAGGRDYIGWLVDVVPNAANAAEHVAIVRDRAITRHLVPVLSQALEDIRGGRARPGEIARELASMLGSWAPTRSRFRLLSDVDVAHLPPLEFLVDGLLPAGGLLAIYGPPGCGKSFLALDLTCSVGTGRAWLGHAVNREGAAIYVAAEGSAGLAPRLDAWRTSRGLAAAAPLNVQFCLQPTNLLEQADPSALLVEIRRSGVSPALIVFDTLHRSMAGGDENSAKDVGRVIENADRIRRETGAAVLMVHHSRKDSEVERGSTSLRGAVDTLLQVKVEDDLRTLLCEKQKDGPAFGSITFELSPLFGSCVVAVSNDVRLGGGSLTGSLTEKHVRSLTALSECAHGGTAAGSTWLEQTGLAKATFYRSVSDLMQGGYVAMRERGATKLYSLTDSGRHAQSHQSHAVSQPVSPAGGRQSHHSPSLVRDGDVRQPLRRGVEIP